MLTLLVTGPGGAGTSTLAAAAAVRAARSGRSAVLLTSQAPALAGLDAVPNLGLQVLGGQSALEAAWVGHVEALAALLPHLDLPPATSVVPLPGMRQLALLAALAAAEADLVVLDAGPLAAATELVALPDALRWWLAQALPPRVRALGAVRTAAVASGAVPRGPADAALAAVPALEALAAGGPLSDPARTTVLLAATARRGTGRALRRATTTLALHGHRPVTVAVRALAGDGGSPWERARHAEEEAELVELRKVLPVHLVAEAATGPADIAAALDVLPDVDLVPGPAPTAVSEPWDGGWRFTVPLAFAERADVDLTRWDDDLVVGVAGSRRSMQLDSLLRRCEVIGSRMVRPGTAAAALEVTFRPDPRLWPEHLLGAVRERAS